ncbi:hypothetical protein MNBD_ALPHA12-1005 [hydrothermal vent metagenome]|uniref:Uncharacterized protein n=1 Tax=hydrothermal vent metagenome TaxID=652676 RepID=A0A3B0U3W1_9ZZZZ
MLCRARKPEHHVWQLIFMLARNSREIIYR